MKELDGKICLITGGTRGIGFETAKLMAQNGAKVIVCGRNMVEKLGRNIYFFKADVSDYDSCLKLVSFVLKKFGRIDVLVANAGITKDSLTNKMSLQMFSDVINVNLLGTFNIVKIVGPLMQDNKYGSIVLVSSIVGRYGNIGQANYAASKAGIVGMGLSWAKEFARKGENVRVNIVSPGYILTDMLESVPENLLKKFSNNTMLHRLGQPKEVAEAILYLSSDKSSYITGAVLNVDGGMRL